MKHTILKIDYDTEKGLSVQTPSTESEASNLLLEEKALRTLEANRDTIREQLARKKTTIPFLINSLKVISEEAQNAIGD